jgi:hypothetical protein
VKFLRPTRHENNNTLKTKGYNLTHNFGHGKQHLSSLLATLNLLAFLFHTLMDLLDSSYRTLREFLPRKVFFDDLRALTRYMCFDGFSPSRISETPCHHWARRRFRISRGWLHADL